MKYEYDNRKNRASQMKRKEIFFSVSHFAMPLSTVNCQLSTVNWTHTFSAKEKDLETGLSYFGSRYYSSDLSIWLSVDPMAHKYPSLSPYVYCANNPIKLVDPNGEEIGDYFNQYGKYLGTDNVDNGKVLIIDDALWNSIEDVFTTKGEDGTRVISQGIGEFLSDRPSSLDLSDEAIVSIFEHYNSTEYICSALEKGTDVKQDNGVLSGITTDHSTHEMKIRVDGNRKSEVIDYYYEIINLFAHEKQHVIDYNNKVYGSESRAIKAQINDPSFSRTRKSFQDATFEYAKKLGIKL